MEFVRKDELMGMLDESIEYWKDKDDCTLITLLGVVADVNKLPTIDSETVIYPCRPKSKWIDYSEDGYVECPFCHEGTNCDDNIEELHYCWNCGAYMRGAEQC